MYHRSRRKVSPITIAELVAIGSTAHGRPIWRERKPGGRRYPCRFDLPTQDVVSFEEFDELKRVRRARNATELRQLRTPEFSSSIVSSVLW